VTLVLPMYAITLRKEVKRTRDRLVDKSVSTSSNEGVGACIAPASARAQHCQRLHCILSGDQSTTAAADSRFSHGAWNADQQVAAAPCTVSGRAAVCGKSRLEAAIARRGAVTSRGSTHAILVQVSESRVVRGK